jgi:hypothetical protein
VPSVGPMSSPKWDRLWPTISPITTRTGRSLFKRRFFLLLTPSVPSYEFKCGHCGTLAERVMRITQAPDLGTKLPDPCPGCERPDLTRIVSVGLVADAALRTSIRGYPYETVRYHPKQLPECRVSATGHPIIESRRHEIEVAARHGLARE